jgi:hypothetical protein
MKRKYFLVLFNEGQEMGYTEFFEGTRKEVDERGTKMYNLIQYALPKATITVEIQDHNCKALKVVDGFNLKRKKEL